MAAAVAAGLEPDSVIALFAIWADRNARLDELSLLIEQSALSSVVNDLVQAGLVQWSPWADLNPTPVAQSVLGLVD